MIDALGATKGRARWNTLQESRNFVHARSSFEPTSSNRNNRVLTSLENILNDCSYSMSDILKDMAQNTYFGRRIETSLTRSLKAMMHVEALGMNTAQPSDLANVIQLIRVLDRYTMPAYLLQRLQHPDAGLNPSIMISTAEQWYPGERKQIVNDSCYLGEEISLQSNAYAGTRRSMSTEEVRVPLQKLLTGRKQNVPTCQPDDNPLLN
ncbi:hypothetical protein BT96DRAFT_1007823 [Gymnopus androsaceus JB14]|uniref:Uncharacterized protein n=1 Tax=Gymnopus androsaceus JB14 TaxID=1447944 RepID=A0A6A4GGU8_9AGAR|nr:hypothetical protein BT96DRAFT_1007823 [Gymnopus androsaceus JB14]